MKKADHQTIQQLLDGEMSPEEFVRFQQRLRDEPGLADLYQQYALLNHTLSEEFEGGYFPGPTDSAPTRRMGRGALLLVLAAVLMVAATAWWWLPWNSRKTSEDLAVVSFSVDAVWRFDGSSRSLGGATAVSKDCHLLLRQGRASVSLEPSVIAVIEGPAELRFLSPDALELDHGTGYFRRGGTGGGLTVTTPRLVAVDSGTEFGIVVPVEGPDEIHILEGKVQVTSKIANETVMLAAGDAAKVGDSGPVLRFPGDGRHFSSSLGRFRSLVSGPFKKAEWRVDYGNPSISGTRVEGVNYSAYLALSEPEPAGAASVVLVTLDVGKPAIGEFHTDGWAGMSFFSKHNEVLFFGDAFGAKPTWSLDVKQRIPVILPQQPVTGPRTVTLRYDKQTGDVSLHEGGLPLKPPFCMGKLPPGTCFDEVRIGASSGAALTVNSLDIRVGGD